MDQNRLFGGAGRTALFGSQAQKALRERPASKRHSYPAVNALLTFVISRVKRHFPAAILDSQVNPCLLCEKRPFALLFLFVSETSFVDRLNSPINKGFKALPAALRGRALFGRFVERAPTPNRDRAIHF